MYVKNKLLIFFSFRNLSLPAENEESKLSPISLKELEVIITSFKVCTLILLGGNILNYRPWVIILGVQL